MNLQIYAYKKNFDVQKAERFFKERNIKYQLLDLNKHKLGKRELDIFINSVGDIENLINRKDKSTNNHPVALVFTKELVYQVILENPKCLITPIVRNGNKASLGYAEKQWLKWIEEDK